MSTPPGNANAPAGDRGGCETAKTTGKLILSNLYVKEGRER